MSLQPPKPIHDFGGAPATAPSVGRVDVSGWLMASGALGLAAGVAALNLLWRPLPGLEAPPGALSLHVGQAMRWAAHWLFPNLCAADARSYAAALAKLADGERRALAWRGCAGLVAACAPSVLLARSCLAPRDGLIALRGSCRHEGQQAVRLLRAAMGPRAKARPDHPIAPGLPYPADMWTRHVLVVAGTGSGKSTFLKPLIERVASAGESLLLFDPKGEFTKGFGGPEILAPWDARSLAWDIAKDMRNIGDMRRFASSMVREAQDPMWSNAARQLMVGFMIYLKETRGLDWGWRELAGMMSTPQQNILPIMSEYHPEAIRAVERASVTTQGILINLASFSASIFDLAEAWGDAPPERRVSFVEWAQQRGRHRQLILQGHGAYPDLTKSYLEGVVGTVAAIVNSVEMDDDESRKLWLIADEAGQMGKMPIRALLELGRSRGMRCVLACQDLAQLEEIYGALMVKAMVSMVGTILVGQMMQGDTAEQLCKALGTREVERMNHSSSRNGGGQSASSTTLSFSRDELAIYKPSELASRLGPTRDRKGVKFALLTGGDAYELFWPHYKMAVVRRAHVPAAWTRVLAPDAPPAPGGEGGSRPGQRSDPGIGRGAGARPHGEVRAGVAEPSEFMASAAWALGLSVGKIAGWASGSSAWGKNARLLAPWWEKAKREGAMDHPDARARTAAGRLAELRQLGLAGAAQAAPPPSQDGGGTRGAAPPTAADIQRLLRQSVEVAARPGARPPLRAPTAGPSGAHVSGSHGMEARAFEAHESRRDGGVERAGAAPGIDGRVDAAHVPQIVSGRGRERVAERGSEAGPWAELGEGVSEMESERAARDVGGELGALALHAAQMLDALRAKPGPAQVVAVAQRPPSEDLEHQRKSRTEPKAKGDPGPSRS